MNNGSSNHSSNSTSGAVGAAPADYLLYFWIAYIVVGVPLTALDVLSLTMMIKRNSARLGNFFLVGLSFGDLLNSLAMFISGCFRLKYTLAGEAGMLTTRLICFLKLAMLWIMATQTTAVLLIVSGFDRLRRRKSTEMNRQLLFYVFPPDWLLCTWRSGIECI